MCGIVGIKADIENKEIIIKKMMHSLIQRGPDNQGIYLNKDIILGHQRLKIIDLSAKADQPMPNEDGKLCLISNGEIYNFKDLRKELESCNHIFKSYSDSEVILHSYEEWGIDCLKKLRGMFSFCIWDSIKKELFLARDRFGIKPLYYYFKNGIFIFSSEVRAILASGLVSKELNLEGSVSYLKYGGLKEPLTIFKDIHSLLPGHFLLLKENELKISRYYDLLDIDLNFPDIKQNDLFKEINFLLKETIKLHLISDVPVAIFLSGGIDSSSLVSLASEFSSVKTISVIFKEKEFTEENYSNLIARKFNTEHRQIIITEEDLLKELDSCIKAMDEPTFDGVNTYFISKIARELGFKVCLSGLGGDEVFCGYNTFKRINKILFFNSLWKNCPSFLRKLFFNLSKTIFSDNTYNRKFSDLLKTEYLHPYFWMRRLFTEDEIISLLGKPYQFSLKNSIPLDKLKQLDYINQISYLEITNYLVDILLRDTDFMSMAHSLEIRVPYLDHKLVEFILKIPKRFKIDSKIPKILLLKSLDRPLPPQIYLRPKKGFVFPFDIWLRKNLKNKIETTLLIKDKFLDSILNPLAVKEIWKGFLSGKISWQRPWALYVLKRWLNNYLN